MKCFRCDHNLPKFMFKKTKVEHIKKMGRLHQFSCRICNFIYAWRFNMDVLDELILLKKAIRKHEKEALADHVATNECIWDYDRELWEKVK